MRPSRILATAIAAAVLGGLTSAANASNLYASGSAGSTTFIASQTTGAYSLVGPMGFTFVGDLTSDWRAGSETIWGTDLTTNALVTIDPATGAATGVNTFKLVTGAPAPVITSIAFDVNSGKLYGNTTPSFSSEPDKLYQIDPTTAVVQPIGTGIGFRDVYALGFTTTGKLYGISDGTKELIEIDTALGTGSHVATLQLGSVYDMAARPEDNVMFISDSGTNMLYTMDLGSGAATVVGPYVGINSVGLAFLVPEPASMSMLAIGALGCLRRRR